jgi:septal ring factor EnvC (AmiA/AmiB activator)
MFSWPVTRADLNALEKRIMSQIATYVTRIEAAFTRIQNDQTSIKAGINSLNDTIKALQDKLTNLPPATIPGDVTADLDKLAGDAEALAAQADAMSVPVVPAPPTGTGTTAGS